MPERVRVSVFDPKTGDTETAELLPDSYILLTGERMQLTSTQRYGSGTVQLTLKPVPASERTDDDA
jgi:hypothetical protein